MHHLMNGGKIRVHRIQNTLVRSENMEGPVRKPQNSATKKARDIEMPANSLMKEKKQKMAVYM